MDNLEILSSLISHDPLNDSPIKLPHARDNIFDRIIRDPNSRWANERRCSEMLCSLLINANGLRDGLLRWLGKLSGQTMSDIDKMMWAFNTEEQAEGKRIDLTIRGVDGESRKVLMLWVVEIKVKSPINMSSPIGKDDAAEDGSEPLDKEDVSQLVNYDKVLGKQEVARKAGFVLSLMNAESKLPGELKNRWNCITWTGLGLEMERMLKNNDKLPQVEQFLGRHMLGFIRNNLWRNEEMPKEDLKLTFEDVALIKATFERTHILEKKLESLILGLEGAITSSRLGSGALTTWKNLFSGRYQVGIKQQILPDTYLSVAFAEMKFYVWVEAEKVGKEALESAVKSVIKGLQKLDGAWEVETFDSGKFADVAISMPLEDILGSKDQLKTMRDFVLRAIKHLKSVKIIESIKRELAKNRKK